MTDLQHQKFLGTSDVNVTLEAIYHGVSSQPLQVALPRLNAECKDCLGHSMIQMSCEPCKSSGERFERILDNGISSIKCISCKDCQGTGSVKKNCHKCTEVYDFEFTLERGFPSGKIQRFEVKDRSANMNLRILHSLHSLYQRVSGTPQHIATTFVISLEQAVGLKTFEFQLPHISGDAKRALEFKSEPGQVYRDGQVHRFVGQGLPVYRSSVTKEKPTTAQEAPLAYGDCLVMFQVEFPHEDWFKAAGRKEKWKMLFSD